MKSNPVSEGNQETLDANGDKKKASFEETARIE
jgi:hypothetical protein